MTQSPRDVAHLWGRVLQETPEEAENLAGAMRGHPFADGQGWMPGRPLLADRARAQALAADMEQLLELIREETLRRCSREPERLAALAGVDHRLAAPRTPGIECWTDSARADVVPSSNGWQVCEINVDSTLGGAGAMAAAAEAHLNGPAAARIRAHGLRLSAPDYYARKAEVLRTWSALPSNSPPRTAVIGITQPGEPYPDAVFDDEVRMLREHGLPAHRVDPRDVSVHDGRLRDPRGNEFDLAVRYYIPRVAEWLGAEAEHLHRIEEAEHTVVFVPRTAFGYASKRGLAWLWEAAAEGQPGYEVVRRRVPYTVVVAERHVVLPEGDVVYLPAHLERNQKDYVLKPAFEMGGRGVLLGRETSADVWRQAITESLAGACSMVAQRFVAPRVLDMPILRAGRVQNRPVHAVISPFLLGGRYAGSFCRLAPASRPPVINWEEDLMCTALVTTDLHGE
ncbi:hypothetical protein ABZ397_30655 [Streptomyces sp. NPDC005876]|uniref:hypothetical protein n=1 Tax=Streptomyces sp. NPDC005876 TaxID=3157076 RepID=UPI0033FE0220